MSIFRPKWRQEKYSDTRGGKRDPEQEKQSELDTAMQNYPLWRKLFDGTALKEKLSITEDPSTDTDHEEYRWPLRFNIIKSYCLLYAGLLWGRGQTSREADQLWDIHIDPKVPGQPGPEGTQQALSYQQALNYWWSFNYSKVRPSGTTQQWAGGCVLKVAWDPLSPLSVLGTQLQVIQPEHFYPVWNPVNFEELFAVKIKFHVSKMVAQEQYGMTEAQIEAYAERDRIGVEEHWDRYRYYVRLGRGRHGPEDEGVVAVIRGPDGDERLEGPNPFPHPDTGVGIIPFQYVPRIRVGSGFFGDGLTDSLEGLQQELNKTLADYGDALTRGSHPPFGISDYSSPRKRGLNRDEPEVILVPRHGALNMGMTRAGGTPAKVHEFPMPQVPEQTKDYTATLLSLTEAATGLTPAARGAGSAGKSGVAMAMELLPTTTVIDWERSHWTTAIAHRQGINEILGVIWLNKAPDLKGLPEIKPGMLRMIQHVDYRPVVPRDRVEVIDEVVRLATARAVSPKEWMRRLGDIEDIDSEFKNVVDWICFMGAVDAAVAGRALNISTQTNPENPAMALPEVSGQTAEPAPKQPAKQAEGLSKPRE